MEQPMAELSDKELVRALEVAARTGERMVDLDAVKRSVREEKIREATNPGEYWKAPNQEMRQIMRRSHTLKP